MPSELMVFSPEVEEILRDIAQDESSVLFRVPREKVEMTLIERSGFVGETAPGLSAAEREILRVHREEVAYVLRLACWVQLTSSTWGRVTLHTRDGVGVPIEASSRVSISEQAERALLTTSEDRTRIDESDCLAHVSRPFPGSWPSVAQLASASHRLVPTDQTRLYAGLDLVSRQQPTSARFVFHQVLSGTPEPTHRVAALDDIAVAFGAQGLQVRAHPYLKAASYHAPERMESHLNLLLSAIQLGADADALTASSQLERWVRANDPDLESALTKVAQRRKAGHWSPTEDSHRLLVRCRMTLEAHVPEVTHVFS
jgi:hypothetical protein